MDILKKSALPFSFNKMEEERREGKLRSIFNG